MLGERGRHLLGLLTDLVEDEQLDGGSAVERMAGGHRLDRHTRHGNQQQSRRLRTTVASGRLVEDQRVDLGPPDIPAQAGPSDAEPVRVDPEPEPPHRADQRHRAERDGTHRDDRP